MVNHSRANLLHVKALWPVYKNFVVKYVLPDGTKVGYHIDTFCQTDPSKDMAKLYQLRANGKNLIPKQLKIIRKNFNFIWNLKSGDMSEADMYKNWECWKGYPIHQIKLEVELV